MADVGPRDEAELRQARHVFRSMGTDVVVIAPGDAEPTLFRRAAARVEAVFADVDRRFSRFRLDSELSVVNGRAGGRVRVSPEFATLLRFALLGAVRTHGLFDPTVLPAVVAAGYDRDFEGIRRIERVAGPPVLPAQAWRRVRLEGRTLTMPPDAALDFGGIAKGWAVDRAADRLGVLRWAVVNAGGDLRVAGSPPDGEVLVAVEDPDRPGSEIARVVVSGGAIATSSVRRRSWGPGLHHLIDPRTGSPAATGVLQATVWAPTCAEAEIRSKWALLAGPEALSELSALLVMDDGRLLRSIPVDDPAEASA
jgi:thiamine biosynthesis lipoprotein